MVVTCGIHGQRAKKPNDWMYHVYSRTVNQPNRIIICSGCIPPFNIILPSDIKIWIKVSTQPGVAMLALRDQENLVHAQQTTAAAKPLNQSLKSLQPKTPGTRAPKTPFKVPLNDENDPLAFGKRTMKTNGNVNRNTAKFVKDAFVTPLGK